MNQFKKGDRVKRVASSHNGMVVGDTAIVRYQEGSSYLYLEGYESPHDPINFELVKDEKENISKFLKENKWFIRTGSAEKSRLVQEWLFEHGYGWGFGKNTSDFKEKYLTNTSITGELGKYILHGNSDKTNAHEIKLEYATTVASVQLPEIAPKKTETQLKLEELQKIVEDAQQKIAELKEEIK